MSKLSKRRTWAALPAVALMSMALLAAGCAAATSSGGSRPAAAGSPVSSGSPVSGGASGSAGGSAPASPAPVPTITAPGAPVPGQAYCANWPTDVPRGPLSLAFQPVSVLRCVTGTTTIPGKGIFLTATLERATSGLGPLITALRHPSGHVQAGTMCPMIAMLPPQIVLIARDGSMLSPTIPVAGCGQLQEPVLVALNALHWQHLSVKLFPQGPSPAATGTTPASQSPAGQNPASQASPGQNPVDLVPGRAKGTPQPSRHS